MKTLIFDLGNVLYLIDEKRFLDCFGNLDINLNAYYSTLLKHLVFDYETGKINTRVFYSQAKNLLGKNFSFEDFLHCWNSLLKGFIQENVRFVNSLALKYKILIFSNINEAHYNFILQTEGFDLLKAEKIYFSHIFGYRKPDPEGFLKILTENSLVPSKTLFIDDSPANIHTAKNLGMKTFLVENPFLLVKKLKYLL